MKKSVHLSISCLLLLSVYSHAATYYFSSSTGDDSRTSAQAQNSSTPWKTLGKLNSFFSSLNPGDQVLFKCGDTLYGNITITRSGTSTARINLGSYGTGAKPVITGFYTVPSWTSIGSGLFEAAIPAALPTLNTVTLDGNFQPIGRWPKLSAANAGYLALQSHSGTTSITSNAIGTAPNFVGGTLVMRAARWVLQRGTITTQTSATVTYTAESTVQGSPYAPADGNGFFFQNHINACTQLGDWAYKSSTHKITMYFGGSVGSHVVKVSSVDDIIVCNSRSYINIQGLEIQGASSDCININSSNNITINGNVINYAGENAINAQGTSSITYSNNTFNYTNNNAIYPRGSASQSITSNTITNTGSVAGMGLSGDGQYIAIGNAGTGSNIQYNVIKKVGYNGIQFTGGSVQIRNNLIDTFCYIKDDGGAIYTFGNGSSGNIVSNNICLDGLSAYNGITATYPGAQGLYMDDNSTGVELSFNTVANSTVGIQLHNCNNINHHDNTCYNCTTWGIRFNNDANTIAALINKNNIVFAKATNQYVVFSSTASVSGFFSVADSNYYCRPLSEGNTFNLNNTTTNLAGWKTATGKEVHSKSSPITVTDPNKLRFEYNATTSNKIVNLGATYVDAKGTSYVGTITLAPFTSAALIYSSSATSRIITDTTQLALRNLLTVNKPALTIYPNPVRSSFALQISNEHVGQMSVSVIDQKGIQVRSFLLNKTQRKHLFSLPSNDLPAGVYFIQVRIGDWTDKSKIIKL